jgi:hypothetical protein
MANVVIDRVFWGSARIFGCLWIERVVDVEIAYSQHGQEVNIDHNRENRPYGQVGQGQHPMLPNWNTQ